MINPLQGRYSSLVSQLEGLNKSFVESNKRRFYLSRIKFFSSEECTFDVGKISTADLKAVAITATVLGHFKYLLEASSLKEQEAVSCNLEDPLPFACGIFQEINDKWKELEVQFQKVSDDMNGAEESEQISVLIATIRQNIETELQKLSPEKPQELFDQLDAIYSGNIVGYSGAVLDYIKPIIGIASFVCLLPMFFCMLLERKKLLVALVIGFNAVGFLFPSFLILLLLVSAAGLSFATILKAIPVITGESDVLCLIDSIHKSQKIVSSGESSHQKPMTEQEMHLWIQSKFVQYGVFCIRDIDTWNKSYAKNSDMQKIVICKI